MPYSSFPRKGKFALFALLFVAFVAATGWAVMWLWNAILPEVAPVKPLTYWQALGLLALCRLLFGGFRGGRGWGRGPSPRHRFRERWRQMSEAEREQMRAAWRERCGK